MQDPRHRSRHIILCSIIGFALGVLLYGEYRFYHLSETHRNDQAKISQLRSSMLELAGNLSLTAYERDRLINTLSETQERAEDLEQERSELVGTVDELQKLTTLDPELLKKYSKVYFLNEHYVPSSLTAIDEKYVSGVGRGLQIHGDVWPHLQALLSDSTEDGVALRIQSSYRSYGTQSALKAAYKVTYGTTAANRFSADQGYSEHQLGTTVDFSTGKSATLTASFDTTPEFTWLKEHAHEYGFVLSYPKGNKYYIYEPWHWRYVGVALATKLHTDGTYLYDIDQRTIDEYLLNIFD